MGGVPPWGVAGWDIDVARPPSPGSRRQRAPRPASPGSRRPGLPESTRPAREHPGRPESTPAGQRAPRLVSLESTRPAREHPVDPAHLAHRLGATDRHLRIVILSIDRSHAWARRHGCHGISAAVTH